MADHGGSVWLGTLRQPMRKLMIFSMVVTAILVIGLMIANLLFGAGIDLKQFLSPSDSAVISLTMIAGAIALLTASIYLSDSRGMIEPEPAGFFDIVSLVCSRLAMLATAIIVLVMFYEVVARYIFIRPTLWANELSLWIAGFVFLLAGLYAMQQRSHIRIYVVYDLFPRWLQKLSDVLTVVLVWAFSFVLIWGGYNESRDKLLRWETFGTAWDPPIPATIKPAILFIVLLVAIQALSNLIADWNKLPEHHSPIDEIDQREIEIIRKSIED